MGKASEIALNKIKAPVKEELNQVEEVIKAELLSEYYQQIKAVTTHVSQAKGKRLRPLILFLSAFAQDPSIKENQPIKDKLIACASAMEMIHTASLIHDDIIDEAPVRHEQASVYAKWGTNVAMPIGVYLYAVALKQLSITDNPHIIRIIGHTVKKLCSGELVQIMGRDGWLTEKLYLVMVKKKTSVLFAAAGQCAVHLIGGTKEQIFRAKHFGNALGLAYQIYDDVMDLSGGEEALKKKAGQDLILGEWTLPLILYAQGLDAEQKIIFQNLLLQRDPDAIGKCLASDQQFEVALKEALSKAEFYLNRAKSILETYSESPYKKSLTQILDLIKLRADLTLAKQKVSA